MGEWIITALVSWKQLCRTNQLVKHFEKTKVVKNVECEFIDWPKRRARAASGEIDGGMVCLGKPNWLGWGLGSRRKGNKDSWLNEKLGH